MPRLSLLLVAAATVLSMSPADARDGCGRGWFWNGSACAQDEEDDSPTYTEPPPRYYGGHRGPRLEPVPRYYSPPPPRYTDRPIYGHNSSGRPEVWFRPYRNQVGALACAQPGYTVQDGVCKRYRGY